jgi:hypothetical protein
LSFGLEEHKSKSFCDTFKVVNNFLRQVMKLEIGSENNDYVSRMWEEVFDAQYSQIYNLFKNYVYCRMLGI